MDRAYPIILFTDKTERASQLADEKNCWTTRNYGGSLVVNEMLSGNTWKIRLRVIFYIDLSWRAGVGWGARKRFRERIARQKDETANISISSFVS
ncbi:hypothetical protein M3629_14680 [Paenibacillus polysaccharolyticus]|uniref:hypothetical protein n=1 Tax=Paenibacillus xylanexedens TaxID=528191 RepID=UPI0011A78A7C|nr:hypothetical protein [Paenibacillus xylanexedens]MCM3134034.1 hypothetical protein [Paenibacillus polysaccharolyticus]